MTAPADHLPPELAIRCPACNAAPGERCSTIAGAIKYREPHEQRSRLARTETTT